MNSLYIESSSCMGYLYRDFLYTCTYRSRVWFIFEVVHVFETGTCWVANGGRFVEADLVRKVGDWSLLVVSSSPPPHMMGCLLHASAPGVPDGGPFRVRLERCVGTCHGCPPYGTTFLHFCKCGVRAPGFLVSTASHIGGVHGLFRECADNGWLEICGQW